MEEISKVREQSGQEEQQSVPAKRKTGGRKKALIIILAAILAVMVAAAAFFARAAFSTKKDNSPVGYWKVKSAASGEVVMNQEDAEKLGLEAIGTIRINKSGTCEISILDLEAEGSWTQAEDGTVSISFGEGEVLTAHISEEGVMTAEDGESTVYTLEK